MHPPAHLRGAQTLARTVRPVVDVVLDEPDPAGPLAGTRGHLRREPTARVHRIGAAVGVGELGDLDRLEVDLDPRAGLALGVVDDDELEAFCFGEFAKHGAVLFLRRRR